MIPEPADAQSPRGDLLRQLARTLALVPPARRAGACLALVVDGSDACRGVLAALREVDGR